MDGHKKKNEVRQTQGTEVVSEVHLSKEERVSQAGPKMQVWRKMYLIKRPVLQGVNEQKLNF